MTQFLGGRISAERYGGSQNNSIANPRALVGSKLAGKGSSLPSGSPGAGSWALCFHGVAAGLHKGLFHLARAPSCLQVGTVWDISNGKLCSLSGNHPSSLLKSFLRVVLVWWAQPQPRVCGSAACSPASRLCCFPGFGAPVLYSVLLWDGKPTDTWSVAPESRQTPPEMPDPQQPGKKPWEPGIKTGITRLSFLPQG